MIKKTIRRNLIFVMPAILMVLVLVSSVDAPQDKGLAFPSEQPEGGNFNKPFDGEILDVSPPGFCWWRAGEKAWFPTGSASIPKMAAKCIIHPFWKILYMFPQWSWNLASIPGPLRLWMQMAKWQASGKHHILRYQVVQLRFHGLILPSC